jgi:predicted peroxiredoxin
MKPTRLNGFVVLGVSVLMSSALFASAQVWACEAIVVTFKQDLVVTTPRGRSLPIIDSAAVEAACVATALARNLQLAAKSSGQKVGMFPALAGVKLANERFLIDSKAGAQRCFDPDTDKHGYKSSDFGVPVPDDYTLLIDLVRQFLDAGGRMVVCPLCWVSREYPPTALIEGAEIGTPQTVGPLFLKAEKVIDF